MSDQLTVAAAAARLGVTPQTVRNYIRGGKLAAEKDGRDWVVASASVARLERSRPTRVRRPPASSSDDLAARVNELAEAVAQLLNRQSASDALVDAVSRERDRYRAEASAAKEAGLRVNAAARELDTAVRSLLTVLEYQTDALAQLLAPASPQDLIDS